MGYFNRNKVTALTETDEITYGSQVVKVGMPIYTYYVSKVAGVDPANGQLLYYAYEKDENGEMVPGSEYVTSDENAANNSKYYVGSRQPLFQGSFGSEFYFGNFDFSFLTSFSVGGKVYDSVYATTMEPQYAGSNFSTNILRRWQKPGDVTDVPAVLLNSGRLAADRWLIDASYFAIKSVQLGYTLPARWTEKAGIQSLRIFATGDNIALFSKLNGMNPQYSTNEKITLYIPCRGRSEPYLLQPGDARHQPHGQSIGNNDAQHHRRRLPGPQRNHPHALAVGMDDLRQPAPVRRSPGLQPHGRPHGRGHGDGRKGQRLVLV